MDNFWSSPAFVFPAFLIPLFLADYICTGIAYTKLARYSGRGGRILAWVPVFKVYLIGRMADGIDGARKISLRGILLLLLKLGWTTALVFCGAALTREQVFGFAVYDLELYAAWMLPFLLLYIILKYQCYYRTVKECAPVRAMRAVGISVIACIWGLTFVGPLQVSSAVKFAMDKKKRQTIQPSLDKNAFSDYNNFDLYDQKSDEE